jgi:hypothetical protein
MSARDLERRLEQLEMHVAGIQATLAAADGTNKKWRSAVEKYAGDEDLLAVFAEAKRLRDTDRREARRNRIGRPKP